MRLALEPGADIAALVRDAGPGESLVVMVAPGGSALDRAMTLAAIGPLAVELAPATRVNALVPAADADPADIEAAADFLAGAHATTGQILTISARDAAAHTAPATR